jgi:predicted small metal-binding protein
MAKKFSCGDVMSGCGWSVTAKDESELFAKISEHAKLAHNITSIPDEVIKKVKSKIKNV